jgi:hypothetical protein
VFTRLEQLAPAGLADFRRADLVQRLVTDVDAVLDLLTRVLLPYAVAALVGIGAVALVGTLLPAAGLPWRRAWCWSGSSCRCCSPPPPAAPTAGSPRCAASSPRPPSTCCTACPT